ncbi:MAG: hypothetical protein M1839_002431 [Geoglossum umbratile]|nr:MAG: hypothetical protein M1839_002431 [Geoglossum umbratile]
MAGIPVGGQGPGQKPLKPCDVFDVIGGVGSGGWLALLLGRFRLTISECLYEYFNIVDAMTRKKTASGPSSSPLHRHLYDIDALIRYVEYLTEEYGVGEMLLDDSNETRCKHTFVVACCKENESQESGFCVFRTYKTPEEYTTRLDPSSVRISDAFAAAGAKRGFLYPFKLLSTDGSTLRFGKEIIPEYFTNATIYALKEIRQQYGDGAVPAIINVGPGIPNSETTQKWEKMKEKLLPNFGRNKTNPLLSTTKTRTTLSPVVSNSSAAKRTDLISKVLHPTRLRASQDSHGKPKRSWSILEKIKSSNVNTETLIKAELRNFDPSAIYVHLMLDEGPKLTAHSDLMASQETQRCTEEYLNTEQARLGIEEFGGGLRGRRE